VAAGGGILATFELLEFELKLESLFMLLAAVKLRGARGAAIEWFDLLCGLFKLDLSTECTGWWDL
jgi:hypothetical protein